jgi:RHS repeat-associated protein
LEYEYNIGTNRLRNTDTADGENYTYDEIGNLISDAEEGIDSIAWTPYGKVRKVEKADNSSVSFRYDASGNRIAKIVEGDTTVYVRDASGNVMGVYKNDTLVEQSIYGSNRLGLMTSSSKTGYRTLGGKKYELSNHLGNVLAVVTDNINLDQDSTWAQVVNVSDYYPFGLAMDGRTVQDSSYRYGFNGQEKDDEIKDSGNSLSFKYRIYDPRIGRFLSVDPLAPDYPWYTPYQFAGNTPIQAKDLEGAEPEFVIKEMAKKGLKGTEQKIAWKNKWGTTKIYISGNKEVAENIAINSGLPGPHNGPADALRHSLFNALNTQTAGEDIAKKLGDAHEEDRPNQPEQEKIMDLHNNKVGREVAKEFPDGSAKELSSKLIEKIDKGELMVLDKEGNAVPSRITPEQKENATQKVKEYNSEERQDEEY